MVRVVVALFLVLSINARAERAEADSHDTATTSTPPPATCQAEECKGRAEQPLTEAQQKYTTPLVNLFGKGIEGYIKPTYGPKIREAIVEMKEKKNVGPLSDILADLFNRVDIKQIDTIRTEATKLRDAEKAKATNRDDLLVTLMDGVVWSTGVIKGGTDFAAKTEAMPFNNQFSKDYDKWFDKKTEYFEKLKQATTEPPSPEAKKWLRENVNQASVFGWVEDQAKKGLATAATKLLDGLSWSNGGQKFIDMWGKANEAQRLFLGTSADLLAQAMTAFSTFAGGLGHTSLASAQHPSPKKEWFYDASKKSIEKGRPNGVTLPAAGGAPVAKVDSTVKTDPGAVKASTGGGNRDSVLAGLTGLANCKSCHMTSEFKVSGNGITYTNEKGTFTAAQVLAVVKDGKGSMPKQTGAVAAVQAWVALQ